MPADGSAPDLEVIEYCADPNVRARMREYCGDTGRGPTCAFVVGLSSETGPLPMWETADHRPAIELGALCDRGADVSRSLWDDSSLPFLFDLDYQDTARPGDAFVHPDEMLIRLEPAFRIIQRRLARWHLHPMAIVTGRGYHFTGRVPLAHPVIDGLADLAPGTPPWFAGVEARRPPGVGLPLTDRTARASAGLGLLLEYLAHRVLEETVAVSTVPVVVNGTIVGPGLAGYAAISLDFSHAGDPLDQRHMRVAFSPYQLHRLRPDLVGDEAAAVPPFAAMPRERRPLSAVITEGRNLAAARRRARGSTAFLPDVAEGVARMAASYRHSRLARFHRQFHDERARTSHVRRPLDGWPACLGGILDHPNDLLLRPAHVQHLVRGLLSRGWPAAEIATLVAERYRGDYGWGDRWARLDATTRADFDVRVFAGLVETGADTLIDFNCVSAQEKGLCPGGDCPFDLRRDRGSLQARFA